MDAGKVTGNKGEEVAWFRMRIMPDGEVPVRSRNVAVLLEIPVGEQDRAGRFVGFHSHRVARHHIRPVIEVSDAPEALRLALRTEDAV